MKLIPIGIKQQAHNCFRQLDDGKLRLTGPLTTPGMLTYQSHLLSIPVDPIFSKNCTKVAKIEPRTISEFVN